ncbi:MAG: response regulator [Candidatus Eisenbacteria sp.]|nr:response regulator [Candidatus Eisenbacteria bacterium]
MGFNILIVDDSKVTRIMIKRTLKLTGIPVGSLHEAENGQVALEEMKTNKIDLVLADINMPVMDGMAMIAQMKADPELASVPVIVISTEGSSTRIEELRSKGVAGYVRKPFTPEDVRDTLRQVVGDWDDEARDRSA